jgi:hypothetical protein
MMRLFMEREVRAVMCWGLGAFCRRLSHLTLSTRLHNDTSPRSTQRSNRNKNCQAVDSVTRFDDMVPVVSPGLCASLSTHPVPVDPFVTATRFL